MPPVLTNEDKKKALSLAKRFETCLIVLGCKIDCSCFHDNICEKYITQRLGWLCLLKANFHLFIDLIQSLPNYLPAKSTPSLASLL